MSDNEDDMIDEFIITDRLHSGAFEELAEGVSIWDYDCVSVGCTKTTNDPIFSLCDEHRR